jgi:hypothetical protein
MKIPLFSRRRPWVRAKFEAVEIPLKRMKKSKNARQKPLACGEPMVEKTSE